MLFSFCTRLISMSLMGTLAIIATLIFKKILSRKLSPKAHLYIWLPVAVRLTVPHMLSSKISVYNYMPADMTEAVNITFTPTIAGPDFPEFYINYMFLVWFTGFALALLFPILSYIGFIKAFEKSSYSPENFSEYSKNAAVICGIKKEPRIFVCKNAVSPMIIGFLRPRMIIPEFVLNSFDTEQINVIFVHEYTHLKRRDRFVNLYLMLCNAIHWFNPFVWMMSRHFRRDVENVCDEAAMSVLSGDVRSIYGKTIIDLVEYAKYHFSNTLTSPMAGSMRTLKLRIKTLCDYGTQRLKLIVIPVSIIISTTLLTGAVADEVDSTAEAISDNITTIAGNILPMAEPSPLQQSLGVTEDNVSDVSKDIEDRNSTRNEENREHTNESQSNDTTHSSEESHPEAVISQLPVQPELPEDNKPSDSGQPKVYTYTTDNAIAQFSDDKLSSGFSCDTGDMKIETIGLISSDSTHLHGYFNIYRDGVKVGDTVRAYVKANPNNLTFSGVGSPEFDFTFKVRTRTIN